MINNEELKVEENEEKDELSITTGPRVYHIKLQGFTRNKLQKMMEYYGCTASEMFRNCINNFYGSQFRKETIGYHQGMNIYADNLERKGKKAGREAIIDSIKKMSYSELDVYLHELGYLPPDKPVDEHNTDLLSLHRITPPHNLEGNLEVGKPHVYEQQQFSLKADKMVSCREIFGVDEIIRDLIKEKLI